MGSVKLQAAAERLLACCLPILGHVPGHLIWATSTGQVVNARDEFEACIYDMADALGIDLVSLNEKGCHWDPEENRRAEPGDAHNQNVRATVLVGQHKIPLCQACSVLPTFKRYRKRKQIA